MDDWFLELILIKLDASLREAWENTLDCNYFSSSNKLAEFLEKKARALSSSPATSNQTKLSPAATKKGRGSAVVAEHGTATPAPVNRTAAAAAAENTAIATVPAVMASATATTTKAVAAITTTAQQH